MRYGLNTVLVDSSSSSSSSIDTDSSLPHDQTPKAGHQSSSSKPRSRQRTKTPPDIADITYSYYTPTHSTLAFQIKIPERITPRKHTRVTPNSEPASLSSTFNDAHSGLWRTPLAVRKTTTPTTTRHRAHGHSPASSSSSSSLGRNLGQPFPVLARLQISPGARGTNAVHNYRELAHKAQRALATRRITLEGIADAKTKAKERFALDIHREAEDTRQFLERLSVAAQSKQKAKGLGDSGAASVADEGVVRTLEKLDEMRRELEKTKQERLKAISDKRAALEKKEEEEEAKRKEKAERERKEKELERAKGVRFDESTFSDAKPKEGSPLALATKSTAPLQVSKEGSPLALATKGAAPLQVSAAALEWAEKYRAQYRELMDRVSPQIKANKEIKSYCFEQKGLITRSVGQLKNSMVFVRRITGQIIGIVDEAGARYGETAQYWVLNLVAKAVVKQAETEVTVKRSAAYPLAAVVVAVMQRHPQLVDLFLVRLVKKCPYMVPQYIGKRRGQSNNEFLQAIGYKEKDDDELESEEMYEERMNGMVALFAAVVQTTPAVSGGSGQPNPLPIRHGWTWLARMVNLAPRTVSPSLVNTFLEVAGVAMSAAYGVQFKKLLEVLVDEWIPTISKDEPLAVASRSRLVSYMDVYRETGVLKEVEGRVISAS